MSPKSALIWTGVILAALLGSAYYAARERRQADAETAALESKDAGSRGAVERLKRSISTDTHEPEEPRVAPRARAAVPPTAHIWTQDMGALIKKSPKLQALFLKSERARLGFTYGPLFQRLNLPPDKVAKLEDAMIEHAGQTMDLVAVADSRGLTGSDPAIAALGKQSDQQLQAVQREVLGDTGYQQEQEYERALPVRTLVSQFAGTVAFTAPLTAQQGEQMTQVLATASPQYQQAGKADWSTIDWDQVDQAAQGILSSSQFATWQQAEPMGGGPSRWLAIVQSRIQQATGAPQQLSK